MQNGASECEQMIFASVQVKEAVLQPETKAVSNTSWAMKACSIHLCVLILILCFYAG